MCTVIKPPLAESQWSTRSASIPAVEQQTFTARKGIGETRVHCPQGSMSSSLDGSVRTLPPSDTLIPALLPSIVPLIEDCASGNSRVRGAGGSPFEELSVLPG